MAKQIKGAPARIYLQHDPEDTGEPFSKACDVTWCADQINDNDIEYVRADLCHPKRAPSKSGDTP